MQVTKIKSSRMSSKLTCLRDSVNVIVQIVDCLQEQKNEKDGHSYLFEELKSELSDECKRSHVWQSKAIDSLVRYEHINVLNRFIDI